MALPRRLKYPEEHKTLTFDFSTKLNLAAGDTLSGSPTATITPGMIVGTPVIDTTSTLISARYSGGASGNDYTAIIEVDTANGDHLKLVAIIEVRDDAN